MPHDARSLLRHTDGTYTGGSFFPSGPGARSRGPKPPHGIPDYTFPMASQKVDENSTAISVTNSAAETTIATLAVPALTIRSEGATRLSAAGTVSNSLVAAGTVTFRLKASVTGSTSTVLATSGIVCSTSTSSRKWALDEIMFGNDTNVQTHWGGLDVSAASAGTLPPSTFSSVGYSTSGLAETEIITLRLTAQMSAASTGFSVVRESAVLEAIL